MSDDWDPEPAELRDGETPDETSHAARNAEQLAQAREVLDDGGDGDSGDDSERPQSATSYPDDEEGRKVWAEVYPGGDMMIELGGAREDADLYLSPGEPEALRDVLDELLEDDCDE